MSTRFGWLYAWRTKGKTSGRVDWESFGHDNHNTANLSTPLSQGISSAELPDPTGGDPEEGCDCAAGRAPAAPALPLALGLGLLLLVRRRTRRRR